MEIKFSLILATLGRSTELIRFFDHLIGQNYPAVETIIIDQNQEAILEPILEAYQDKVSIKHLRSKPGLSRARNVGLSQIRGDIITFPDDDCWYPKDLLFRVEQFFNDHPEIAGLTGRSTNEDGLSLHKFDPKPGYLTKLNTWKRTSSVALFFRSNVIKKVGGFDETLGLGSGTPWGASEDVDYPLRVLANGYTLYYEPKIVVNHPFLRQDGYEIPTKRAFQYGAGIGRVWKKHQFPLWYISYHLFRPFGGTLLSRCVGNREKARYHWHSFRGRWFGWKSK